MGDHGKISPITEPMGLRWGSAEPPPDMSHTWICGYCSQKGAPLEQVEHLRVEPDYPVVASIVCFVCPNPECREFSIEARLSERDLLFDNEVRSLKVRDHVGDLIRSWPLIPPTRARVWPACVPKFVIDDYVEACAIETASPKASATLSRRCLQSILRDFFKVSKSRLIDEIKEVMSTANIRADIAAALDAMREVGNVGAHPERDPLIIVDVEPEEATAMINFIELLIDETYVNRAEQEARIQSVKDAATRLASYKAPPVAAPALPQSAPDLQAAKTR